MRGHAWPGRELLDAEVPTGSVFAFLARHRA